jgi:hypothetical protein
MAEGWLIGVVSSLATLIPVLAGAYVLVRKAQQAIAANQQQLRQKSRASDVAELTAIVERLERQIARQDAQILQQQTAIDHLAELHQRARERALRLAGYLHLLLDYAHRVRRELLARGIDPGEVPEMPALEEGADDAEFTRRTQAQSTVLTHEIAAGVQPKETGGEGPAGGR